MAAKKQDKTKTARKPPPKMVIRRNAAHAAQGTAPPKIIIRNAAPATPTAPARTKEDKGSALGERLQDWGGTHAAAGMGAGGASSVLAVFLVGKGWIGPKTTAGVMMGTGVATTTAGYLWKADHVMAAGLGVTAAGAFSLVNQLSVEGYEAAEKRAEDKRKLVEEEARKKQLAEAPAGREGEQKHEQRPRNQRRRLVVIDANGNPVEHSWPAAA